MWKKTKRLKQLIDKWKTRSSVETSKLREKKNENNKMS